MEYMFYGCENLEEIDLSNFHIPKKSKMRILFSKCKLKSNYINTALQKKMIASYMPVGFLTKAIILALYFLTNVLQYPWNF